MGPLPPHPGTALGLHLTPTLQGAAPVSPRSRAAAPGSPPPQSDGAGLSQAPLKGPYSVFPFFPSRQRDRFALPPLTAACPTQPTPRQPLSLPRALARLWLTGAGPACPAGGWRHEPPAPPLPAARSLPFESTTRWRRPKGRSPGAGRHSNRAVQNPPRCFLRQSEAEPRPPGAPLGTSIG